MAAKATVTGTLRNSANAVLANTSIKFRPVSTPYVSGSDLVLSGDITETSDGSGLISQVLTAGQYDVHVNGSKFRIQVPGDDGSHDITTLVTGTKTLEGSRDAILLANSTALGNATGDSQSVSLSNKGDRQASPLRLTVIGSYGSDDSNESLVAALVEKVDPAHVITTGGNNPGGSSGTIDDNIGQYYSDFIGDYGGGYGAGAGAGNNMFWPVVSDTDYAAGPSLTSFTDYFTLPNNERYYQKNLGNVEIFVINSSDNEADGNTHTGTQGQWLQAALAASTTRWKIVVFSHAPTASKTGYADTQMASWPLADWGANAVFCGNANFYERLLIDGIPVFVVGSSGLTLDTFGTPVADSQYRRSEFGFLMVEATDYSLKTWFVSYLGPTYDAQEFVHPTALSKVYVTVNTGSGLKQESGVVKVDRGHGSTRVAQSSSFERLPQFPSGNVVFIKSGSLPDPLVHPELRYCLIVKGYDPAELWVYNWASRAFVRFAQAETTTPVEDPALSQLALPTISPSSGKAEAFSISHAESGVSIYYSINGGNFDLYTGSVRIDSSNTARPVVITAYASKTGWEQSELQQVELE